METVLISGGSGIIGKHLGIKLKEKGYRVTNLSRSTKKDIQNSTYFWDVDNGYIENEAIETADYIIHLAGANIADKRWTKARKEIIINSRVKSCNLLLDKLYNV